jgi:hypothetical protein
VNTWKISHSSAELIAPAFVLRRTPVNDNGKA